MLSDFWKLDAVPTFDMLTKSERACEDYFKSTYTREESGVYTVKLPFHSPPSQLGDSRQLAMRRFQSLENSLLKRPQIYEQYKDFMREYLELRHMEGVPEGEILIDSTYYMPHHAVLKESSTTTKLRVVFDASAKTTSGLSLNDILMVGPRVQQELFPILLRFRTHKIAVCADVEKMFRQIRVHPEDTNWQRMLWRDSPSEPLSTFRLVTVTYGTACAPYLSTRVMKQLALDEQVRFPLASKIALRDFYVDDLLSGAQSEEEANVLVQQLNEMMKRGGFRLRKWISNSSAILENIPECLRESSISLEINSNKKVKVLGINWNNSSNTFHFSVCISDKEFTKRTILSEVAKIFDPMGWLAPTIIYAKILLQELWNLQLGWDELVDKRISRKWKRFYLELPLLSSLQFPRYVLSPKAVVIDIHAFCDASEKAYCAVIYLRTIDLDSSVKVSLLTSKTRVAPLKTQSLPRLELCAALLLTNLLHAVLSCIELPINNIYAWTDSRVTLAWVSSEPRRWLPFVANRVAKIQEAVPGIQWNYVAGKENPADCGTRGFIPSEFLQCELWMKGPQWLNESLIHVQQNSSVELEGEVMLKELKKSFSSNVSKFEEPSVFSRFSSWLKLCRVLAWCLRFRNNCSKLPTERIKGYLSTEEFCEVTSMIVRIVQRAEFPEELFCLESGKPLKTSSKLLSLSPFLDSAGVMRVGGRLRNSTVSNNQKHPMILPKNHNITRLIIKHYHDTYLHAGTQLLTSVIRHRFWIVNARDIIRKCINQCVICRRVRAQTATQLMADLPASRVTQSRAFSRVGIDLAGPFNVKYRPGRGVKIFKCYVCLFICFTTRAIHLELVGDLSTKSFLATLKRFIARRGKPCEIHSDCATNFIGANKELRKAFSIVQRDEQLQGYISSENIKWLFNPPSAPHFGGLWEAGIKSMKHHLKRCLGTLILTYEEFLTLITQIESCLNSRPLVPASSDCSDLEAITPGHFLTGAALSAIPESNQIQETMSCSDRWRNVQRLFQHFWNRWSSEYLSRLQQRPKWCKVQQDLKIGDMVLIKNENLPPLRWKLGRIIKVHPGLDEKVRVVSLRTSNGEIKRPIAKLCALPFNS